MPAPSSVSALWPLSVAIEAAIVAARAAEVPGLGLPLDDDGPIALDDPPVYSGAVPENTPLVSAYIVLANSNEVAARGAFRRRGRENFEELNVWTSDRSKRSALLIAGALVTLIDGADLELDGYGTVRGRLETVLTLADPSTNFYRALLRYSAVSLNPVPAP